MSHLDRRGFVIAALSAALSPLILDSGAQKIADENHRDYESSVIPDLQSLGTNPALAKEVETAKRLLGAAHKGQTPINIFSYLEGLTERNVDGELFNAGWRTRWNPVIVTFFKETKTTPQGDLTAWCAASLNWVLARAGLKGTASASSGSFRECPGRTTQPKPGDIAVFAASDPEEAAVGHGHVGIYLDQNDKFVYVLGGNQKNKAGHHQICRKWIPKSGALKLHSFHSIESLSKV